MNAKLSKEHLQRLSKFQAKDVSNGRYMRRYDYALHSYVGDTLDYFQFNLQEKTRIALSVSDLSDKLQAEFRRLGILE